MRIILIYSFAVSLGIYWFASNNETNSNSCDLASASDSLLKPEMDCRRFLNPQNLTYRDRQRLGQDWYSFKERTLQRLGGISRTESLYLERTRYSMILNGSSQSIIVSRLVVKTHPEIYGTPDEIDLSPFAEIANEAVEFVIKTYRDRRPHWTEEFLSKLRTTAMEVLEQSIYITVQDGILGNSRPIRGTIRLIMEKDGVVPMEPYLGIKINTEGKFKVEPGNLALDKDFKEEAWSQLVLFLRHPDLVRLVPGREIQYVTYADRQSRLLYSGLNYTAIPQSQWEWADPNPVPDENGRILKNDIPWTPMQASGSDLEQIFEGFIERNQNRGNEDVALSASSQRNELFDSYDQFQSQTFIGRTTDGRESKLNLKKIGDSVSVALSFEPGNIRTLVVIPKRYLPLGSKAFPPGDFRDMEDITYKEGVLEIPMPQFKRVIRIHTNEDLSIVSRVYAEQDGKEMYDVRL